jgi:hypothetical protein
MAYWMVARSVYLYIVIFGVNVASAAMSAVMGRACSVSRRLGQAGACESVGAAQGIGHPVSIDISRRPGDVFAYAADFSHFPEWQGGVVSARREGDGPLAVGSRAIVTRRAGRRELTEPRRSPS